MGGQQAYFWPIMYPNFVERFVSLCGSARTSPHNQCFLEGPKATLVSSEDFKNGYYTTKPQHGLRAFGRVYSAWAYGQTWFRQKSYLYDGKYSSLNNWLRAEWEQEFLGVWDANDLIALIETWYNGDVSRLDHMSTIDPSLKQNLKGLSPDQLSPDSEGDLGNVLGKIKAKGLIMPCKSDLFFTPEDSEAEVEAMTKAGVDTKLVVVPSVWGHMAGGGYNETDDEFIKNEVIKFLESKTVTSTGRPTSVFSKAYWS